MNKKEIDISKEYATETNVKLKIKVHCVKHWNESHDKQMKDAFVFISSWNECKCCESQWE